MMISELPSLIDKASVTFTSQKKGSPFVKINFRCTHPDCKSNMTQVQVCDGIALRNRVDRKRGSATPSGQRVPRAP